jgi:SAM-dependent methyltransferase
VDVSTRPKPWDYIEIVQAALKQARSVLDMRTGSGQLFADMLKRQPVPEVYATEGYAPNLAMARQLLEPLGAAIYAVHDEHLPFADNTLELIVNRHGSYDPREVLRVLKPGHLFIRARKG